MKRTRTRTFLAALTLAAATAGGSVAVAPTATAAAQACADVYLKTASVGGVGTTATKSSSSSCNDLNLAYSNDSNGSYDRYAGRLYGSSGWFTCAKGYVTATDGNHDISNNYYALCTDVNDGTKFTVASYYEGGDTVRITH